MTFKTSQLGDLGVQFNSPVFNRHYLDRSQWLLGPRNLILVAAALALLVFFRCEKDEPSDSNPPNVTPINDNGPSDSIPPIVIPGS